MQWNNMESGHQLHSFLTSAIVGDEWSASRSGRFNYRERATSNRGIGGWARPRTGGWVWSKADLPVLEERKLRCHWQESNHDSSLSCSVRNEVQQGKAVGTWSYHPGAFSSKVKNTWSCTSTHSYDFMLCLETTLYPYLYKGIMRRVEGIM